MDNTQLEALFDKQAAHYDTQWKRMAAMNHALHFLLNSVFAELPDNARVLCVGVATGTELINMANDHPGWHFTAVEPSAGMMAVCRARIEAAGLTNRCSYHQGYLDSLPTKDLHDAATSFLVSQFILDKTARVKFFSEIASQLKIGGVLASADLSASDSPHSYEKLLYVWQHIMSQADLTPEMFDRIRQAYANDVGVLPATETAALIQAGGFSSPTPFFQAGLIHAWFANRVE